MTKRSQNRTESVESNNFQRYPLYSVDSFNNGISFGQQPPMSEGKDPRECRPLYLTNELELAPLRSRYSISAANPRQQLESHLARISQQGVLSRATVIFGGYTDPFYPFEGKFDVSMRLLELFQRYTPGHLIIQTRSPLLVIALPVLKRLGKHVSVNLGIETNSEDAVLRYTPHLPHIEDRLRTATALRRFGVEVNFAVSPVLPYGDWKEDAKAFASLLVENGDFIHVTPFLDGDDKKHTQQNQSRNNRSNSGKNSSKNPVRNPLRNHCAIARLAEDRKFHWLRPDAAKPLINEIQKIAPAKLELPVREHLRERQLSIFAA